MREQMSERRDWRYQAVGVAWLLFAPSAVLALDLKQAAPLPDPVTEVQAPARPAPPPPMPAVPPGPPKGNAPTGQILSPTPPVPVFAPPPPPRPAPAPAVAAPPPPPQAAPQAPGAPPRADALARMQTMLGRPFSDPERKAVLDAGRSETAELRITQSDYADRAAALTRVYRGRLIELLPPLNVFAEAPAIDLRPAIEKERGLPLTKEEQQGLQNLELWRRQSTQTVRQRYIATISGRTGLAPQQVTDALNGR